MAKIIQSYTLAKLKAELLKREKLLKAAGKKAQAFILENLDTQGKSLDEVWPELSKKYKKWKTAKYGDNKQMLELTGMLKLAVTSTSPQVDAPAGTVTIGVNIIYAAIHHFGGTVEHYGRSETFKRNSVKNGNLNKFVKGTTPGQGFTFKSYKVVIPARPYFKLSNDQQKELVGFISSFIK